LGDYKYLLKISMSASASDKKLQKKRKEEQKRFRNIFGREMNPIEQNESITVMENPERCINTHTVALYLITCTKEQLMKIATVLQVKKTFDGKYLPVKELTLNILKAYKKRKHLLISQWIFWAKEGHTRLYEPMYKEIGILIANEFDGSKKNKTIYMSLINEVNKLLRFVKISEQVGMPDIAMIAMKNIDVNKSEEEDKRTVEEQLESFYNDRSTTIATLKVEEEPIASYSKSNEVNEVIEDDINHCVIVKHFEEVIIIFFLSHVIHLSDGINPYLYRSVSRSLQVSLREQFYTCERGTQCSP
jgi:hypothetical protein